MEMAVAAYASGLFDGEGCISVRTLYRSGRVTYALHIQMAMTDEPPIRFMAEHFGGSAREVKPTKAGRRLWRWDAFSSIADRALKEMLPYLLAKRAQAECAIELQSTINPKGRYPKSGQRFLQRNREDVLVLRKNLAEKIAALKDNHQHLVSLGVAIEPNSQTAP